MKASIFTVTQYMGQMNSWDLGLEPQHLHMTWDMLTQIRNANLVPDSHTEHHVHFYDLQPPAMQTEAWGTQRDLVSFLGDAGSTSPTLTGSIRTGPNGRSPIAASTTR